MDFLRSPLSSPFKMINHSQLPSYPSLYPSSSVQLLLPLRSRLRFCKSSPVSGTVVPHRNSLEYNDFPLEFPCGMSTESGSMSSVLCWLTCTSSSECNNVHREHSTSLSTRDDCGSVVFNTNQRTSTIEPLNLKSGESFLLSLQSLVRVVLDISGLIPYHTTHSKLSDTLHSNDGRTVAFNLLSDPSISNIMNLSDFPCSPSRVVLDAPDFVTDCKLY